MTDKPVFCWHIHDRVLVESLAEPLKNRIKYIKENKPKHERETRLRLMQPVKGRLPDAVVKARVAYVKAWDAWDRVEEAYVKAEEAHKKAREAYRKALRDHKDEIEALHAKECPNCPWDGRTIFPEDTL